MKKKEELNSLRREIQIERANMNACRRILKRMNGKEVIYPGTTSDKSDEERLMREWGFVPDDAYIARAMIQDSKAQLETMRQQVAQLKHELESRLPLTPCGFAIALVRALRRRRRKRTQHA